MESSRQPDHGSSVAAILSLDLSSTGLTALCSTRWAQCFLNGQGDEDTVGPGFIAEVRRLVGNATGGEDPRRLQLNVEFARRHIRSLTVDGGAPDHTGPRVSEGIGTRHTQWAADWWVPLSAPRAVHARGWVRMAERMRKVEMGRQQRNRPMGRFPLISVFL
jgi:hypothetical protein